MAEIDRIVVLDIERDGSSSTTAEQEMIILRNDLASTDPTKGAGMVGYRSSESYSDDTVGKALTDIESNMSAVEDSASQALSKSNEALAKATTAESKIDNALLKGNNLSDLTDKVAALENIGAVPTADIVLDPTADKTPKAGDDGKIGMNWVRDLEYELSNIQRDIEKIEYPDGIVPFIDWDFTSGQLPNNFMFRRGTEATYFDKFGVLRTAQADEPVFEYDPVTKEALGLRRERESSNRMSYSNFNSTYWSAMAGAVVNVNYSLSPDGTVTSNFLTTDATEEAPKVPYIHRRYIQYDAGKDYTSSVFMKINPNLDSSKVVRLVLHAEVYGSPNRDVNFIPATGRVYVNTGSAPKDWGFQECGGGWIRIWMTDTVSEDWGGGTGWGPLIWFTHPISQGQGVEWWGMQVEEGVSPTSYIPTDGAAKTRLREEIQYQPEGRIYLSNKATIYLDYTPVFPIPQGTVIGGFALVIGERNNNYNYLGIDYDNVPLDGRTQSYLRDSPDTSNKGTITTNVKEFGKPFKYACSFSTERVMHSSCNGSDIRSAPNDPVLNSYFELSDRITLFGSTTSGTTPVRGAGWFRKVQIYNEVFDDEKLIRLTTTTNSKPITDVDSLTVNQGKNYPLRPSIRGGENSQSNTLMNNLLLDVKVFNAEPGKVYRVAYQQNGASLGGSTTNDWIIEEFDAATYETAPARTIIMSYLDDQYGPQQQIDREGGIQTIHLYPPSRPSMRIDITCDAAQLPPAGTPIDAYSNSSNPGYSYIIDPSALYLPVQQSPQQVVWDYGGILWDYSTPDGGTLTMVWRSGSWMYRIGFGPKGTNSLPDIRSVERASLGVPETAIWTAITPSPNGDWSGPYVFEAVNNGDGTSSRYTGGNHGRDGNIGGGKSATNLSFTVMADGQPIQVGTSGVAESIKIVSVNDVMAFNTCNNEGNLPGGERYALREFIRYDIFPGIVGIKKHPVALEDVLIRQDNGPQIFTNGFQSGTLLYYGASNTRTPFTSTTNSGNKSVNPDVWAIVFQDTQNGQLSSWMDRTFGVGDGRYVRNNWPYIRGGGSNNTKFYHAAVVSSEGVPLSANEFYEWRGGWAWQQATTVSQGFDSTVTFNRDGNIFIAQADSSGITIEL